MKLSVALAGVLLALLPKALAGENLSGGCVDVSVPRNAVMGGISRWIELTPEQWQFLHGVYVELGDASGLALWRRGCVGATRERRWRLSVLH